MWDLSSLTKDQTHAPCIRSLGLNHQNAREFNIYFKGKL